jgi:hypothetical protein
MSRTSRNGEMKGGGASRKEGRKNAEDANEGNKAGSEAGNMVGGVGRG